MLSDIIISIQTGYENKSFCIETHYFQQFYNSCIKVGNELSKQQIQHGDSIIKLKILPTIILNNVPCLIGTDSIIDIEELKKEINILKNYININILLYIDENTSYKTKGKIYLLADSDIVKIKYIFGFIPNIISMKKFLVRYKSPLIIGSGGFLGPNGDAFNIYKNTEHTQSSLALKNINPHKVCNIIGIFCIFEIFKDNREKTNETLYSFFLNKNDNKSENSVSKLKDNIFDIDPLLSYRWIDLNKINNIVKQLGVTKLFCLGSFILNELKEFTLIENGKEIFFNLEKEDPYNVVKYIINYFKYSDYSIDIIFI